MPDADPTSPSQPTVQPHATAVEPRLDLDLAGSQLTLLGTAHVSRASADMVTELLSSGGYDAVAVELCSSRYQSLTDPNALARLDLLRVIRQGHAYRVVATLALGAYQQRLADDLGVEPGVEQRRAIELAAAQGLPLLLIDREIGVTLRRVAGGLGWWGRLNLFSGILAAVVTGGRIAEQDIEHLKEGDVLETAFAELAADRRELYVPLIEERDRYMAARLRQTLAGRPPGRVLVVVGAGHLRGLAGYLTGPTPTDPAAEIADLEQVPRPGPWIGALPWLIVGVILAGFAVGFSRGPELGWAMLGDWALITGGLSALGTLIAGGHPLTILSALAAAPLTTLHPALGVGMVTGAVELALRRPQVGDFARLRQDLADWRGWWRNRVSRVLLVFVLSSLGAATGTYVAGLRVLGRLFPGG
jgi:pheromone shutdown-related protein TraB